MKSNLQRIASNISGYEINEIDVGARDDGFFDQETLEDQIEYLIQYSLVADDVQPISREEAIRIIVFFNVEGGVDTTYHAYQAI